MNRFLKIAAVLAFAVGLANSSYAQILTPQGRLTLTSNTPVMTSDVVGATTVYYTPYVGNSLPVSNGTSLTNQTFSQLSLPFTFTVFGQVEDVYAISVSGAFQLCLVDGWSATNTGRSSGFGLTTLQGVWVNASTLTSDCETTSNLYTVPAKTGIYLGSIYTSIHPGNTTMGTTVQFTPASAAGGSNTLIGLWNAYNRVRVTSSSADSTSSWSVSPTSWRNADNSASNSITWLDGLGQTSVSAAYDVAGSNSSVSGIADTGIEINALSTPTINTETYGTTAIVTLHSATLSPPILGLNVAQALERVSAGTETFYGYAQNLLTLETEY